MKRSTKVLIGFLIVAFIVLYGGPTAASAEDSECDPLLDLTCVLDPILDPILPDPEPSVPVEEPPVPTEPPVVVTPPSDPPAAPQPAQPAPAPEQALEQPSAPVWKPIESFPGPSTPRSSPSPTELPFFSVEMPTGAPTPAPTPSVPGRSLSVYVPSTEQQFGPAVEFDTTNKALPYLIAMAALTCGLISVGLFMILLLRKRRIVR